MTRRRGKPGQALIGTMVFLVLMMLLWMAAFSHLSGYVYVAKAVEARHDRATGQTRAMTWGLALLESGVPPTNPYACRVTPGDDPARVFVVTFQEGERWQFAVTVRPAGPDDASLPAAPTFFSARPAEDTPPKTKPPTPPPPPK
jgi:hypothetical protein